MRILFAISILALLALLWAAAAMVSHVRRARRRRRRANEFQAIPSRHTLIPDDSLSTEPQLQFGEPAPVPAETAHLQHEAARRDPEHLPETVVAETIPTPVADLEIATIHNSEFETPEFEQSSAPYVSNVISPEESSPVAESEDPIRHIPAALEILPESEQILEPVAAVSSIRPGLARPVQRADWSYFNKDMGDLTDPYETPRQRPVSATHPSTDVLVHRKDTA